MRRFPYFVVNTFTDSPFCGNPAAVCLLDEWLDDRTLLKIAGETHAPATSFLRHAIEPMELRWFTPTVEEDMCGHGTLGAAWVVLNQLRPDETKAVFATRAGMLSVGKEAGRYGLDLPARAHSVEPRSPDVEDAIGGHAEFHLRSTYHIAIMKSGREVASLKPDLQKVAALELPGLIVSGPGDEFGCDIVTRYFAPAKGIPEDHATGSAHSQIIPYWSRRLGRSTLKARQLSQRGGIMICDHVGDRIRLTTDARLHLKGEVYLQVV